MRIRKFSLALTSLLVLACLFSCITSAEPVQQTLEFGDYEFTVPEEWSVTNNDNNGYYIYGSQSPYTGAYVFTSLYTAGTGIESLYVNTYMDNYVDGFFNDGSFTNVEELPTKDFEAEAEVVRCYTGLFSDFQAYICFWIQNDNVYCLTYSDVTLSSVAQKEEFSNIISSLVLKSHTDSGEAISDSSESTAEISDKTYVNIDDQYKDYARNPDTHMGDNIEFSGKVIQVIEDSSSCQYRVAVGGDSDSVFFVEYTRPNGESRILKNDQVTVRGVCTGVVTYESTMGGNITIPSCIADKIELYEAMDLTVTGNQSQSDSDVFPVTAYTYNTSKSNRLYLAVTNNSNRDVKIDVSVKFFDESGALVGVSNADEYAFSNGTKMLISTSNDTPFTSFEYEIVVQDETVFAAVTRNLETEVTVVGNKVILGVKNAGAITAEYVEYDILFLKDGQVVDTAWGYVTDSDSEIKVGKTQYIESKSDEEFDEALVFLKGRGDK